MEVATPVYDAHAKDKIRHIFDTIMTDDEKGKALCAAGELSLIHLYVTDDSFPGRSETGRSEFVPFVIDDASAGEDDMADFVPKQMCIRDRFTSPLARLSADCERVFTSFLISLFE